MNIHQSNKNNNNNNSAEIEEAIARIRSHKGVEGILIMTKEGAIIQSTLTKEQSTTHAALLSQLTLKTASIIQTLDNMNYENNYNNDADGDDGSSNMFNIVNDIVSDDNLKNNNDKTTTVHNSNIDELTFLRIRSKKREILIAPDKEFLMVVIQNPNVSDII